MHTTTLRKVGGSVMMAVPPAIREMLKIGVGSSVGLHVDHGRLIVDPKPARRYTLDELIAQCDPTAPLAEEDPPWLYGSPLGNELI